MLICSLEMRLPFSYKCIIIQERSYACKLMFCLTCFNQKLVKTNYSQAETTTHCNQLFINRSFQTIDFLIEKFSFIFSGMLQLGIQWMWLNVCTMHTQDKQSFQLIESKMSLLNNKFNRLLKRASISDRIVSRLQ